MSGQQSSLHRRSAARTAVVWQAVRDALAAHAADGAADGAAGRHRPASVLDVGGGTGELAVRVAELGHRVVVVDPSPDALAILGRRAEERGVADLVTGRQGDLDSLSAVLADSRTDSRADNQVGDGADSRVDMVLCHGVLEIVDDPAAALAVLAEVLRPGGTLSLLVSQRHAAVVARAMAGHFGQARALLDPPRQPPDATRVGDDPGGQPHRRFTSDEVGAVLADAGFTVDAMHAVRVFVDLVPSSLVDLEPGAAQALVDLERAVSTRPEYLPLATQLHVLATRH